MGYFCGHFPWLTLLLAAVVAAACASGIRLTRVTTDPVELWSAKTSRARTEKDAYQEAFGRFYRIEQVKGLLLSLLLLLLLLSLLITLIPFRSSSRLSPARS